MNVFITVDTECWPRHPNWRETALREDARRELYGETSQGEFGVGYQMQVLNSYGLKAVFFVEALFACAAGLTRLRELVDLIQSNGHEVQLHIHPEWLAWIESSPLPGRTGQNMKEFSAEEQAVLIGAALENLRSAGARDVCAFRAGNYGADLNTLKALARHGIAHDTSYNACYLNSDCGMQTAEILRQPTQLEGVYEFPISCFSDWPGHWRHAQLCACSSGEMQSALTAAWRAGWKSFVIVSHSFELISRRKQPGVPPVPDWIVIRRFQRLCRFLAGHRDRFRTSGFAELTAAGFAAPNAVAPLRSGVHRTAYRVGEQLTRRLLATKHSILQ